MWRVFRALDFDVADPRYILSLLSRKYGDHKTDESDNQQYCSENNQSICPSHEKSPCFRFRPPRQPDISSVREHDM